MNSFAYRTDQLQNIIITGSAGYIGKKLIQAILRNTSASVIGIDRAENNFFSSRLQTIQCDLSLPEAEIALTNLGCSLEDSVIFHLAGLFVKDVALSWHVSPADYERDNLIATKRLVDAVLQSGYRPRLFVFSSTACVYDGVDVQPTPTGLVYPISGYGESKLVAEREVERLIRWIPTIVVLRLSRILGISEENMLPQDIVSDFIERIAVASTTDSPCIIGSALEVRPYVHIDDLINIFMKLITSSTQENFTLKNVTSVTPVRVGDISEIVARIMLNTGLLQSESNLKIVSRVRTRIPILYPLPCKEFQPMNTSSSNVVTRVSREYCLMLRKLLDERKYPNLLSAVEQTRKLDLSLF